MSLLDDELVDCLEQLFCIICVSTQLDRPGQIQAENTHGGLRVDGRSAGNAVNVGRMIVFTKSFTSSIAFKETVVVVIKIPPKPFVFFPCVQLFSAVTIAYHETHRMSRGLHNFQQFDIIGMTAFYLF